MWGLTTWVLRTLELMIVSLGMNFFLLSTRSYKPSEYLAEIEHSWFKKKKNALKTQEKMSNYSMPPRAM